MFGFIVVTDHELHCDVKVDVINSIEIISRARELYVDDSPLELMVRALDAEGKGLQRVPQNYLQRSKTPLCSVPGNSNVKDKSRLQMTFIFSDETHVHEE